MGSKVGPNHGVGSPGNQLPNPRRLVNTTKEHLLRPLGNYYASRSSVPEPEIEHLFLLTSRSITGRDRERLYLASGASRLHQRLKKRWDRVSRRLPISGPLLHNPGGPSARFPTWSVADGNHGACVEGRGSGMEGGQGTSQKPGASSSATSMRSSAPPSESGRTPRMGLG